MKHLFTTGLLFLAATSSQAQVRVVAYAVKMYSQVEHEDVVMDTISLVYNGNRESNLLVGLRYDTAYTNPQPTRFQITQRAIQSFDAQDNITGYESHLKIGNNWENYRKVSYRYDPARNKVEEINYINDGTAWKPTYGTTWSYNSAGKVTYTSNINYDAASGMWLVGYYTRYQYNAGNLAVWKTESYTGSAYPADTTYYTYNAAGLCTDEITTALLDTAQNIRGVKQHLAYTYNSNNQLVGYYGMYGMPLDTFYAYTKAYNSNGTENHVTTRAKQGSSWVNRDSTYYVYNTDGYLKMHRSLQWKNNYWDPTTASSIVYYYGPNFPSAVPGISTLAAISLWPVPAHNMLYINTGGPLQAGYTLTIAGADGRVHLQQACTGNTTQVNTTALPPGIYTATIKGNEGMRTCRFIVQH